MADLKSKNVEGPAGDFSTENVKPLLNEIKHALQRLSKDGTSSTIDLLRLPLTKQDLAELENFLGQGEVKIKLKSLGASDIIESRFSGVWLVKHFDASDKLQARLIEITPIPSLAAAPPEDIAVGLVELNKLL